MNQTNQLSNEIETIDGYRYRIYRDPAAGLMVRVRRHGGTRKLPLADYAQERSQAAHRERSAEIQRWLDDTLAAVAGAGGWCVKRTRRLVFAR